MQRGLKRAPSVAPEPPAKRAATQTPVLSGQALEFTKAVQKALVGNKSKVVAVFYSHPKNATPEQQEADYVHSTDGEQDFQSDRRMAFLRFEYKPPSFEDVKSLEGLTYEELAEITDFRNATFDANVSEIADFLDDVQTLVARATETLYNTHTHRKPLSEFHPADLLIIEPTEEFINAIDLRDPTLNIPWDRFEWINRKGASVDCYVPARSISVIESQESAQRIHIEDWQAFYDCIQS